MVCFSSGPFYWGWKGHAASEGQRLRSLRPQTQTSACDLLLTHWTWTGIQQWLKGTRAIYLSAVHNSWWSQHPPAALSLRSASTWNLQRTTSNTGLVSYLSGRQHLLVLEVDTSVYGLLYSCQSHGLPIINVAQHFQLHSKGQNLLLSVEKLF